MTCRRYATTLMAAGLLSSCGGDSVAPIDDGREISAQVPDPSGDTFGLREVDMIAFVSFDVDQDAATGFTPTIDEFRRDGGSSAIGAEFELELANYDQNGTVAVRSATGVTGRVTPAFSGNRVTVRIPKALLGGDDGFLNAAGIVGATGAPSDIIPESGHLELGRAPQ